MEMKTIKKTKTELEIEITGEDETILHPITHILLQNDDVDMLRLWRIIPWPRKNGCSSG